MGYVREEIQRIKEKYGDLDLVSMVHQYLMERDQENQKRRIEEGRLGKFYPSSVGQCKRKIVYQMLGYPSKPKDGRFILIMDNGTYFHERMEKLFEEMGILITPELTLKDDSLRISGRTDAVIWNFMKQKPDNKVNVPDIELYKPICDEQGNEREELVYKGSPYDVLLVEFKSIKSKSFDYLKDKPKREHEMQLQLYFYLTGVRAGLVYYENKDTQEQKYFYVEYNQQLVNEIIRDIKFVNECVDKGVLPEREYAPDSFQCRFCDYLSICHPVQSQYSLEDVL